MMPTRLGCSHARLRLDNEARALEIYKGLGDEALAAEDFYLLGLQQERRGNLAGAVESWQLGVQKDPGHAEMLASLAQAMARLDRFSGATFVVQQLLLQPGWKERANLLLGDIYDMMNAPEQAVVALGRGLEGTDPSIKPAEIDRSRLLLARCLLRTGKPSKARALLAALSAASRSDDHEFQFMLARCDLQEGKSPSSQAAAAKHYVDVHPLAAEPAPYVGAARCAGCHPRNFRSQQRSRHGRTFFRSRQIAELPFLPKAPLADPTQTGVVHTFHKSGEHLEVETRIADRIVRTVIDYAFGSGDRGLTLVGHNDKNHLFESRLSYYSSAGGWDVTSGQSARPDQPASSQGSLLNLDVVRRCILCHQTNPMAVLTTMGPEAADPAIGCERCHGPGGHHLLAVAGSLSPSDLAIARPSAARGEPIIQLCGQCHDPTKVGTEPTPSLQTAIRFQASSLTWSRCYIESGKKLDCVTCHNPHRDAETNPRHYEARCLECHAAPAPGARPATADAGPGHNVPSARTTCPVQSASGCVSCHMPKGETPIPHSRFTDHFIRIRRDDSSASRDQNSARR